jgi:hypothetical protein
VGDLQLYKDKIVSRESFRDSIRSFFKQFEFKVYDNFDHVSFDKRKFTVIGTTGEENCASLKQGLLSLGLKVIDIITDHYIGLRFEGFGNTGIILAPKEEFCSLDPDVLNQTRDSLMIYELQEFGRMNNIEDLVSLDLPSNFSLIDGVEFVVAETTGVFFVKLLSIKYENSHKLYLKYYLEHKNSSKSFKLSGSYENNIKNFSSLYLSEIKAMASLLQGQSITIHDVGTNVAQFPLLLAALPKEDLFGLDIDKIIASDIGWTGEHFIKLILRKKPEYKPIHFMKINLITQEDLIPFADVIVANDVLEHLPNEEVSLAVLKSLWHKANRLLIVHVPLEPEPNSAWEHYISFSSEKIRDWASQLQGGHFLSDDISEDGCSLTDRGFLIISK